MLWIFRIIESVHKVIIMNNIFCRKKRKTYFYFMNRSPAEGRGARPPVTSGNLVKSGNDWIWDFRSSRMALTLSNLSRYISKFSSARTKRLFCECKKSRIILPTFVRSFNSCSKRPLYSLSSLVASCIWKLNRYVVI